MGAHTSALLPAVRSRSDRVVSARAAGGVGDMGRGVAMRTVIVDIVKCICGSRLEDERALASGRRLGDAGRLQWSRPDA